MRDAEDNFFQEPPCHLPEGAATIIPINDIVEIFFPILLPDLLEDDEVSGEAAFEFIMVLLMQVRVVDIEEGGAGLHGLGEESDQVADRGPDKVGAPGPYLVAEELVDDAIELTVIAGRPESVFGAGVKAAGEDIEIGSEVIGEDEKPHLVGGADVENAFEAKGAGCQVYLRGRVEVGSAPGGFSVFVQGQQEARVSQGVVMQGQVGERGVTAEIGITALVHGQGVEDIGS